MENHIVIYIFHCKLIFCQNSVSQIMIALIQSSCRILQSAIPKEKSEG